MTVLKCFRVNTRGEHIIMEVIRRILTLAPAFINALTQATCPDRQASWRGVTWSMVTMLAGYP